ncbi:MAG: Fic family protein [Verrucomicrobiota bacterium]
MPTEQAATPVGEILAAAAVQEGRARERLQAGADISHGEHIREGYLEPMIQVVWIERTLPGKPTWPQQRSRLTPAGLAWLATSTSKEGT